MRHIKAFNENKRFVKEELLSFCEENLAYFLDDYDFELRLHIYSSSVGIKLNLMPGVYYLWDDIKDHIIPFLIRLKVEYKLRYFNINFFGQDGFIFEIDKVINDEVDITDLMNKATTAENSKKSISYIEIVVNTPYNP